MATTNIELTGNEWQQVIADGEEFMLQSIGGNHVTEVAFGAAPATGVHGIMLFANEAIVRAGIPGAVFARSQGSVIVVAK